MSDGKRPTCYCETKKYNPDWKFLHPDLQDEVMDGIAMNGPFKTKGDVVGQIEYWECAYCHGQTSTVRLEKSEEELDQYDLERCVCTLCDHLDDFEDLDRMANGDFTEEEDTEIWSTFSRDATKEEIAAIKAMIFARYCKFIGKG